jgi:hypothetical protein
MGDQHHTDRSRPEALADGGEMLLVIGTWIDDDGDGAGVDDPGIRAGPGVRSWVRRDYS